MNKMLKYVMWSLAIAVAFTATGSMAGGGGGGNVFGTVTERLAVTFQNARSVIFIVGGFGLIGLGFAAIFGKVNWKWLAALACGLAIVAVAGQVVDYVTRDAGQNVYDQGGTALGDTMDADAAGYGTSQNSGDVGAVY